MIVGILALTAVLALACGADPSYYPGGDHRTSVLSGGGAQDYATPSGKGCISTPSNPCITPQSTCGDGGRADVILNPDGSVLSTLCYPAHVPGDPLVIIPAQGPVSVGNKELLILGPGQVVNGNLSVDGNNTTIFGSGPAVSVVNGSLAVEKNNGVVRGLYIRGDAVIDGNNTALVWCVIEGNVTINSNNNLLADCDIFGKVTINGNNNQLVSSRVQSGIAVNANNTVCRGNFGFTDGNTNHVIEPIEVGAALTCN